MSILSSTCAYPIKYGNLSAKQHYHNIIMQVSQVPIGAFTWWFGTKANKPMNWLVLDGSEFNIEIYPQLYRILGSNKLPNLTGNGFFIKAADTAKNTNTTGITLKVDNHIFNYGFAWAAAYGLTSVSISSTEPKNITAIPLIKAK